MDLYENRNLFKNNCFFEWSTWHQAIQLFDQYSKAKCTIKMTNGKISVFSSNNKHILGAYYIVETQNFIEAIACWRGLKLLIGLFCPRPFLSIDYSLRWNAHKSCYFFFRNLRRESPQSCYLRESKKEICWYVFEEDFLGSLGFGFLRGLGQYTGCKTRVFIKDGGCGFRECQPSTVAQSNMINGAGQGNHIKSTSFAGRLWQIRVPARQCLEAAMENTHE